MCRTLSDEIERFQRWLAHWDGLEADDDLAMTSTVIDGEFFTLTLKDFRAVGDALSDR